MSRRKQPNPKHAKQESDLEELACLVHLPTDLLYVKESIPKEEEEEEVEEGKGADIVDDHRAGYAIFAKKELKADVILATYRGHFKTSSQPLDNGDDGNCLKFKCFDSGTSVHVMVEDDGHWLKLIRKATSTSEANICLRITCSDVVCRVAKDVSRDGELKVTCEISDRSASDKISDGAFDQAHKLRLNEDRAADSESLSDTGGVPDVRLGRSTDMLDTFTGSQDSEERDSDGVSGTTEVCQPETKATYEEHQYNSYDSIINSRSSFGNEVSENAVSPSSDLEHSDSANRKVREGTTGKRAKSSKNSINTHPLDAEGTTCSRSSNSECEEKATVNSEQSYECSFCAFQTYSYSALSKHTKSQHMSSEKDKFPSDPASSASAYCEACSIQFMSAKTYRVHKAFYCKSRHESLASDVLQMHIPPETDSREDISGNKHKENYAHTNGMIPNVIHPRAIFAAISTDPLILLPCSLVSGQGLVPQNGLISTGVPIVLPTGLPSSAIVENGSASSVQLNPTRDRTTKSTALSTAHQPTIETKCGNSDCSEDSTDKKFDDIDVLNLSKSEEKTLPKAKTCSDVSEDVPLDLSIRKRKTSCFEVQRSEPRPVVKRRNSFASVSPTTPPVHQSYSKRLLSASPEPHNLANHHTSNIRNLISQITTVSPPTFSNDASSSSGFGASSAPTLTINDVHTLCSAREDSSPAPPVLLPVLENPANPNARRPALPYSLPPPKLLKQGNNRCEDCNIVFYKYDNYLAHKKHYCAYRRRQLADQMKEDIARANSDVSSSDDNSGSAGQSESVNYDEKSNARPLNQNLEFALENLITVHAQSTAVSKPSQSAIFRCDACGVKFSTADNLNAHQTYYCSRKAEFPYPKFNNNNNNSSRKNSKSRDEQTQSCLTCGESEDGHEELCCPEEWKCNYCDIVCPSLKSARKHLLTHSEIRGFCCIVCGYRGNTLRGMRSHVYEHLNGDASQIEDILASSVVVDPVFSGRRIAEFGDNEEACVSSARDVKLIADDPKDAQYDASRMNSSRDNVVSDECSRSPQRNTHVSVTVPAFSANENKESLILKYSPYSKEEETDYDERQTTVHSDGSETGHNIPAGIMCDVLIKTEAEDFPSSPEKIVPERKSSDLVDCPTPFCHIKEDPETSEDKPEPESEEEIDVEESVDKLDIKTEAPPPTATSAATSVICRVSSCRDGGKVNNEITKEPPNNNTHLPKKRKLKTGLKSGLELKYCKSCDITFHHLSNFVAHKKFYCVSRNFQQETAPVQ